MAIRTLRDLILPPKVSTGEDMARGYVGGLGEGMVGTIGGPGDVLEVLKSAPDRVATFLQDRGVLPKDKPGAVAQYRNNLLPGPMEIPAQLSRLAMAVAAKGSGRSNEEAAAWGNMIPSPNRLPTSKDVTTALRADNAKYVPQTRAGKYARTVGQFTPGAIFPGSTAQRTANVVAPAFASETAGQLTEGTPLEPWARLAGAVAGGIGAGVAMSPKPTTRLLAEYSSGASDDQLRMAQALREDAARRGITLTQAEAVQQITNGATNLGTMQRVLEGTRPGSSRIGPVMSARPEQTRNAVVGFADNVAPATDQPSVLATQAQQGAEGVLNQTRQQINAMAEPHYARLPGQSLPDDAYQQLASNPSYLKALEDLKANPELAPLLQAEMPLDLQARMTRAGQQGFDTTKRYAHGTGWDGTGELAASVTGERGPGVYLSESALEAGNYATKSRMLGSGSPNIRPVIVRQGAAEPGVSQSARVVRDPNDVRSVFDQFPPPNPDNDLNVINRVVQQLDQMKDAATPSAVNPQGNYTLASQRGVVRALADDLAGGVSPDWRAARDTVAEGRRTILEPLQSGPLGTIASAGDIRRQTSALFPNAPAEGTANETANALRLLMERENSPAPGLVRQHVMNTFNEAGQDLQTGQNQWGGAKWAAQVAGNPEQERTLLAGVDAIGSDSTEMRGLIEALRATGKRQAPGSMTAYNTEELRNLGRPGTAGQVLSTGLNPPGAFRRMGEAFKDWQLSRNADELAQAILASPEEATQILLHARQVLPAGRTLTELERLALTAGQSRLGAE